MTLDFLVSSESSTFFRGGSSINSDAISSIIEGTRESLARLRLDYVDIIFAHRPDITG